MRETEPTEEEGLRAFQARVGCYSGGCYADEPRWVERSGRRVEVREIETRWQEEERKGWRLTLADGTRLILYYVPQEDLWSVVEL